MGAIRLVKITAWAGQSQILQRGYSPTGPRQNMLDMKCRPLECLTHPAILAALTRSEPNLSSQL
jgi:hypothetical protein